MTSLRWLKLNRTGLCYLPEELAALQKLVRSCQWAGGWTEQSRGDDRTAWTGMSRGRCGCVREGAGERDWVAEGP